MYRNCHDWIHNRRRNSQGYFFINGEEEKSITKPHFIAHLRGYMKVAGFPSNQFTGHSFQIGATTIAANMSMEDSMIQTLGRWHSAAFLCYIRMLHDHLTALSMSLAQVD